MRLSILERRILNSIQTDLPISKEPFRELAKKLKVKEDDLIGRIKRLKERGIIRNFSASISHKKLGFKSTLLALRVPPDKVEALAKKIVRHAEVTHCFLREGDFNLWIVFIYKNGRLDSFLKNCTREIGSSNILNLATQRQFKLKTAFKI